MFRCLVEDQCPACGCNSLRGAINAEAVGNSVADRVEGVERTGLSSTKPATISVRHRDKLDLFSYGKQKLIFILFLDCFSLSSPSPPPCFSSFPLLSFPVLKLFPLFPLLPFVPTFSNSLSPFPYFLLRRTSVSISNDDPIYGIVSSLFPSLLQFLSVRSFRLFVFAAPSPPPFFARSFHVVSFNALL